MNEIAQNRRKNRYENGSLFIENSKKRFRLDEDQKPTEFVMETRGEANFMVEEFMLLANLLVGEEMVNKCQKYSLLRKHDYPKEEKIQTFNDFCR